MSRWAISRCTGIEGRILVEHTVARKHSNAPDFEQGVQTVRQVAVRRLRGLASIKFRRRAPKSARTRTRQESSRTSHSNRRDQVTFLTPRYDPIVVVVS